MEKISNSDKFSFIEPLGHFGSLSKFERYWKDFTGPFSLYRQRIPQYSVYAGMTHFPLKYSLKPFSIKNDFPTDDWIESNLLDFIRIEFIENNSINDNLPDVWPPKIVDELIFQEKDFESFLEASEWTNRINIDISNNNSAKNIAKCIYDLLCNNKIGSYKNKQNNNLNDFIDKITPAIEDKNRLLFVFPGFPFKDQNRFRIPFNADMPDMAEISFMIRLHNLVQSIYQVHPYGVDIVVLTDGYLYKDIFGIPIDLVDRYNMRLKYYRNRLNLQGALSFISLKDLIDRSSHNSFSWELKDYIKERIKNLVNQAKSQTCKSFDTLIAGMKWNIDSRNNLKSVSDHICWKILRWQKNDIENEHSALWEEIHNKSTEAAFEYSAVNLMLKWTNLIFSFFPDAIRGTIHPKPNQFALSSGGAYAWNGVAYSKNWPKNIDDIRVVPYLLLESTSLKSVKFENSNHPCFYTDSINNINIELAKKVLPNDRWVFDSIIGRKFLLSDIEEFIKLGMNDINYSWERKIQNESYFSGLFQFRLSHYNKFGFGIQGIWMEGKLIGQFGLQVLDEGKDQIEFVIFLGKNYIHKGLGSKLTNYIFSKCKEVGLLDLYGVVRPDNTEAISLVEKAKGIKIKTIKHFNQEGILYRINLKNK